MLRSRSVRSVLFSVVALASAAAVIALRINQMPHFIGVRDIWETQFSSQTLAAKRVAVRGRAFFDHHADHKPTLYLVDERTPENQMTGGYAGWFGIRIADLACDTKGIYAICRPFDPTRAAAFEFVGTVHEDPAGMLAIFSLSDIDFGHSRGLIDGTWQPIPVGEFQVPLQ